MKIECRNSSTYSERNNAGNVGVQYGKEVERSFWQNTTSNFTVKQFGKSENCLPLDKRYMYEIMGAKAISMNNIVQYIGTFIMQKYNLEAKPFTTVSGAFSTYGRIVGDADGKLNSVSVILEGTRELVQGQTIPLNLSRLNNYAIFPGQTVAVQGDRFSSNSNSFMVRQITSDGAPSLPDESLRLTDPLHLVVAAGPYTLQDNLTYQPLQDFLKYLAENVPDVLILTGPFVDASHSSLSEGLLAETFDSFFEGLIECVMSPFKDTATKVVLIPSYKDAHHHIIYPTLPYKLTKQYQNLHCVPDPCMLDIHGLIIGATSTDVLLHLGKEEICSMQAVDRMSRLVSHLLNQQSFYPLYPPDAEITVDHEMLEQYAMMEVMPHLLIVPSNLKGFIKNVGGCLVVNPERLVKGYIGGTFARLKISTGEKSSIVNSTSAQIVHI